MSRKALRKSTSLFIFLAAASAYVLKSQPYFQQELRYKIEVTFDDRNKTLKAFEQIEYLNNSPQSLDFIYFHLWPNAYKNRNTALANQKLDQGSRRLHYADENLLGYIDSLDFKVDGRSVKLEYDKDHIDICRIFLNSPLPPGGKVTITTPFFVKIPHSKFSRLGYLVNGIGITQWYPKPAVYDRDGWHPMPYLDQGEFYSEFGSFDVSITLPKNYVLAATGDRVNAAEEEAFLEKKILETADYLETIKQNGDDKTAQKKKLDTIPADPEMKTVRFRQEKVHDFAWFADKGYLVMKGEVSLPESGRTVNTWVYFTKANAKLWKSAIHYVNDATLFYSRHAGEYPYNHVTAVDGSIMAGGGMEYPNITVIGGSDTGVDLDMVITHEVGHNWFYGILGSNERRYPFLDEGVNSLFEQRYMREKYPREKMTLFIQKDSSFNLFHLNKVPYWRLHEMAYYLSMRSRRDQATDLHSADFSPFNYGSIVYSKTAVVLDYLLDWLGEEKFDKAMHAYFDAWKFRHPGPEDFIKALESSAGVDLSAFSKHLISSTDPIDYKLKRVKRKDDGSYQLKIKNVSGSVLPFNITAFKKNGETAAVKWYDGFNKNQVLNFPAVDAHRFKIDGADRMPDINRKNNNIRLKGLFKRSEPLQLNLITAIEDPLRTQLNYVPLLGGNFYNGLLTGISLHNYSLYEKRFEYLLAPMWGWGSRSITGFAEADYKLYPRSILQQVTLGVKAKTFGYDEFNTARINEALGTNYKSLLMSYYKVAPYIGIELRKKRATGKFTQTLMFISNNLFIDSADFSQRFALGPAIKNTRSIVNCFNYQLRKKSVLAPFNLNLKLEQAGTVAKASGTLEYNWIFKGGRDIGLRLFAGTFISGSEEQKSYYAFRASGYSGYQDYTFRHNFVARNLRSGFGFSQFAEEDGNLKSWTPYGQSATWMGAINLQSPKLGPLRLFADMVICDPKYLTGGKQLLDAGVMISLVSNVIDIYVPLVYSDLVKKGYELNDVSWYNRIRFTFNIHKLAPRTLIRENLY